MNRRISLVASRLALGCAITAVAACGSGPTGLIYSDPPDGALRLVRDSKTTDKIAVLDFEVGAAPLTGYSTGFDLPLDVSKASLGKFTPGTALDPGTAPAAAQALIATQGPLGGMLVVGLSQKASGTGAVAGDATLPPGTVLFTIELDLVQPPPDGVIFDGTATGFALPSGGLRNKIGATVVDASQVKIGKLEFRK